MDQLEFNALVAMTILVIAWLVCWGWLVIDLLDLHGRRLTREPYRETAEDREQAYARMVRPRRHGAAARGPRP